MCMAKSLHCSPEPVTTLLIGYTLIQKKKKVKRARLNFPGGPVVRTVCFHYKGTGLMPDWGIRILHACRVAWQINEWMERSSVRKSVCLGCSKTLARTWSGAVAAAWAPFSEDLLGAKFLWPLQLFLCFIPLEKKGIDYTFLSPSSRALGVLFVGLMTFPGSYS